MWILNVLFEDIEVFKLYWVAIGYQSLISPVSVINATHNVRIMNVSLLQLAGKRGKVLPVNCEAVISVKTLMIVNERREINAIVEEVTSVHFWPDSKKGP